MQFDFEIYVKLLRPTHSYLLHGKKIKLTPRKTIQKIQKKIFK